jgi:Fe2+ or Zn2+ uptake regulation protein
MIAVYEAKKAKFQHETYGKLVKDLDKFENKEEVERQTPEESSIERLTPYQKAIFDIMTEQPKLKLQDVSNLLLGKGFNSSQPKVSSNIRWMKSKGIIIVPRGSVHK